MLPATTTCTGTVMIPENAFASDAVWSNIAFRSPLSDVTNGSGLPFDGTNSMCQRVPPSRPRATSRICIAENSENDAVLCSFFLRKSTEPRGPSMITSSNTGCLPIPTTHRYQN